MDKFNKLLIIDGSYMLHRQLRQPSIFELKSKNGEGTGGIYGFLRSLNKEIFNTAEAFPVVVFDHGLSRRRIDIDPHYKHAEMRDNRQKTITSDTVEDAYITEYRKQRNKLAELLPYFGVPVFMFDGFEGDDLIFILTEMSNKSVVLTDDKDMLQLLSEYCDIKRPMADEYWTYDKFLSHYGYVDTFDFVLYKAIRGDESDNIPPSCKGVGDKNIKSLIKVMRKFSVDRDKNLWYSKDAFPSNESEMKMLCNKLGVEYRKAFLNIDIDRFIKNVGLVDLSLVEEFSDIRTHISSELQCCNNNVDFLRLMKMLCDMGITDVPVESLIANILVRHKYLYR